MNYIIIGLIILFWLDYRNSKKKIIQVLEDLDNRVKKLELPGDFREHGKLLGTPPKKVEKEIEEALEKF